MTFEPIKKQRPPHSNPPSSGLQAEKGGDPPQAEVRIVIALQGNVESNSHQILVLNQIIELAQQLFFILFHHRL